MMNFIRRKLKFLMWVVAVAFVGGLFFVGGRSLGPTWLANIMPVWLLVKMPSWARSAGIVMKIGDYNVKIDEFKRVKENSVEYARLQYKDNFDAYSKNIDFDERATESITKYALLLQEADRYDIYISEGDLEEGIKGFPYGMPDEVRLRVRLLQYYAWSRTQDGGFNSSAYSYLLRTQAKITPEEFSREVENGLRIARLKNVLNASALVTDLEFQREYRKENEKAKIRYAGWRYKDLTDKVEIDDTELAAFFQENVLDYGTSDEVNISFIKIDPQSFEERIEISDGEVASYYKAHREHDYFEPEKVRARHILVRAGSDASAEDKAKAKAYAEDILKEAKETDADFPALAETYGKDPFDVIHEELGYFERGKMEKPFEDAAFALLPGEVGDVVQTNYGYHVLRVEDKRPAQTKPLEEVKGEIINKLKAEQAVVAARQKADDIQYAIMSEEDLNVAVDANPDLSLRIEETGFFAKSGLIPKIGANYTYGEVAEEAFKLKEGEISDLVEITSYGDRVLGYFIFKLMEKKSGGIPNLDDVRADVTEDLKDEKSRRLAMETAAKVMAAYDPADNLDKIALENDLEVSESEPFALSSGGRVRGKPASINSKSAMLRAFSVDVGEVAGPFEDEDGVYIIELVERDEFDEEKFAEDKDGREKLRAELLEEEQRKLYNTWYQKVRANAEVISFISTAS